MPKKSKSKKTPTDISLVLDRLSRAFDTHQPVGVRRWIAGSERVDGFVTGVGAAWVALAKLDDQVLPDGWSLLRLRDIKSISIDPDPDCFEIKALRARNLWPPTPTDVALDDVAALIRSAARAEPVITVFVEDDRPHICWIGSVMSLGERTLRLLEIDTQGEWRRKPRAIDLEDITRIEFGGGYEEALRLVAGPPPMDAPPA